MIICTSLPLILCMKFPIYIDTERIHDLRQIPFLIGTLYGGPLIGIILLGIMLIFRVIFYGVNFLIGIVYMAMLIVAAFSSSKFKNLNRRKSLACLCF